MWQIWILSSFIRKYRLPAISLCSLMFISVLHSGTVWFWFCIFFLRKKQFSYSFIIFISLSFVVVFVCGISISFFLSFGNMVYRENYMYFGLFKEINSHLFVVLMIVLFLYFASKWRIISVLILHFVQINNLPHWGC